MNQEVQDLILKLTGAKKAHEREVIQSLWSGYGEILRVALEGCAITSVVVKHVRFPADSAHPRGWNTNLSHERKVRSYKVEMNWYEHWSSICTDAARVPRCLGQETIGDEVIMILEDLDAAGYPLRKSSLEWHEIKACLRWLATFHATFLGKTPEGLWAQGSYWHLDTRPDELDVLDDQNLKKAASTIDDTLKKAKYQSIIHGDAKIANFCFSPKGAVSAVDFQYVGGGCGMIDVAYFMGSCMYEDECAKMEWKVLGYYFTCLKEAVNNLSPQYNKEYAELESEWRDLYPYAWTDFYRFLKGWSPGHWKLNSYSEQMSRNVLADLGY
ncbi:MAG: phosphotransferase [Planctomycetes bacterium]|nr:phosphotransferase [Planctomycetota bacterium]